MIYSEIKRTQWIRNPKGEKEFWRKNVIIIGCGGIGSNIVDILANIKNLNLILFDDDIVDIHNINRSPFTYSDEGKPKTLAVADMVKNRNFTAKILCVNERFNEEVVRDLFNKKILSDDFLEKDWLVFDCRDNDYKDHDLLETRKVKLSNDQERIQEIRWIRAAYNGFSMTLDANWMEHPVWGPGGYTTIPSAGLPTKYVAFMAVLYADAILRKKIKKHISDEIHTFDMTDIMKGFFEKKSEDEILHQKKLIEERKKIADKAIRRNFKKGKSETIIDSRQLEDGVLTIDERGIR